MSKNRTMSKFLRMTFVALVFGCCSHSFGQSEFRSQLGMCNLPVPKSIKSARANFSVTYTFNIGSDGSPQNLRKIADKYVGIEPIANCIRDWNFVDVSESEVYLATFRWTHGRGWTGLAVTNSKVSYVISIKNGLGY